MNKMIDSIASSLWSSLLDLLWGFNHMILTQRASELLSIITSLGFLSPTVMQSGVHNGPTNMRSTLRKVFRRLGEIFKAFIDDCVVGTGSAYDTAIPDPCDMCSERAVDALEEALFAFLLMVLVAVIEGMKFKVSKMHALHLVQKALGFVCGRGTIGVDPDKTEAIV